MYYHPHTAIEWNTFLEQKYGYGLWEFSDCISQFLILRERLNYLYDPETGTRKKDKGDFIKYLSDSIEKFESLKTEVVKTIYDSLNHYDFWREGNFSEFSKIKLIIKEFHLYQFFKELSKRTKINKRMLSHLTTGIRLGRPIHLRTQLASIWAQVMKDNRGSNWIFVELLLAWFFDNFEGAVYRKELGETRDDFNQFNLKNEYYRVKKKYMNYIIGFRNTFFPIPRESYTHKIEFHKKYIKLGNEDDTLVKFPNGVTFP